MKNDPNHKLLGLCGLYDGVEENDLTDLEGNVFTVSESSISLFAASFQLKPTCTNKVTQHKPCFHPLGDSETGLLEAKLACGILKGSLFQACHSYLDPTLFINMCVEDVCARNYTKRPESYCDALSLYSRVCAWYGNVTLKWRSSDLCRKYRFLLFNTFVSKRTIIYKGESANRSKEPI